MKRSIRRLLAAPFMSGILALGLLGVNVAPAGAVTAGVAVVQGSGTVSPGLTAIPTPQSFTFTSTTITTVGVVNDQPNVLGSSSCGASGSSIIPENYAIGAGTGGWGCSSGPLAGKSGGLVYVRVGAVVPVALTGGMNGALACEFSANQLPPATVTSYSLTCAGAGAGT